MTDQSLSEIINSGQLSETGFIMPVDIAQEDWVAIAEKGQTVASAMPWVIGDILAYGALHWPETWQQALQWTDRSNETLRKWMQVAAAFSHERRSHGLKFTYYQAVAFLPPEQADALLAECAGSPGMKSDELRRRVQALSVKKPRSVTVPGVEVVNNQLTVNGETLLNTPGLDITIDQTTPLELHGKVQGENYMATRIDQTEPAPTPEYRLRHVQNELTLMRLDMNFLSSVDPTFMDLTAFAVDAQWLVNAVNHLKAQQKLLADNARSRRGIARPQPSEEV